MPSNTDTLLPCPFCGNRAFSYAMDGGYVAECEGCACRTSICDSRGVEVETWNTRPTTDAGLMPDENGKMSVEEARERGLITDPSADEIERRKAELTAEIIAMHEARPTTDVSTDVLVELIEALDPHRYIEGIGSRKWIDACCNMAPHAYKLRDQFKTLQRSNAEKDEALRVVEAAMLRGGDGVVGDFGWNITKLNKARPLIRKALSHSSELKL
jgi:hypothetical protein